MVEYKTIKVESRTVCDVCGVAVQPGCLHTRRNLTFPGEMEISTDGWAYMRSFSDENISAMCPVCVKKVVANEFKVSKRLLDIEVEAIKSHDLDQQALGNSSIHTLISPAPKVQPGTTNDSVVVQPSAISNNVIEKKDHLPRYGGGAGMSVFVEDEEGE